MKKSNILAIISLVLSLIVILYPLVYDSRIVEKAYCNRGIFSADKIESMKETLNLTFGFIFLSAAILAVLSVISLRKLMEDKSGVSLVLPLASVLLVLIIFIYWTQTDGTNYNPERCDFYCGLECVDKALIDSANDTVAIAVRNSVDQDITIYIGENEGISRGQPQGCNTKTPSLKGYISGDSSKNFSIETNLTLNKDKIAILLFQCNNISRGKFSDYVGFRYRVHQSGKMRIADGRIFGRAS